MKPALVRMACAAACALVPTFSHAVSGISDGAGDFLTTFAGSSSSADLDVLSATVLYDSSTDLFKLTATMSGAIGSTAKGLYVWGVNRGAGTANFASMGIDGVRFDLVVLLRPDGTASIGGGPALPAGSVTIAGNTITGIVSGALLPSTGFANKLDYTWNLWPRDTTYAGNAAISDFAPDNANFTSTAGIVPVPEPGSWALMAAGMGVLALRRRAASA